MFSHRLTSWLRSRKGIEGAEAGAGHVLLVEGSRMIPKELVMEEPLEETLKPERSLRQDEIFLSSMGTTVDGIFDKMDKDTIIYVLSLLDTPKDLAHAARVCNSWRRYVVEGKFWKQLCIKSFPEIGRNCKCLSGGDYLEDPSRKQVQGSNHFKLLEAESSAYGLLLQKLLSPPLERTCISEPLHASSIDNLPHESIAQTLFPGPEYPDEETPSYWSSKGQGGTSVPETLTYRLVSDLCVVHDVKVQPYLASFQRGHPIYSSQMVRFRFGYSQSAKPCWSGLFECILDVPQRTNMDDYIWTYVSPTFPMSQENTLQTFRLPKPTLCIGGIFQIEFIGRVQTQESDGLYYICISHVHVTGRPLSDFKFEGVDAEGQFVLKHLNGKENSSKQEKFDAGSGLKKIFVSSIIEHMRSNRGVLRNRTVSDMLLRYLLDAGLLEEEYSEGGQGCQESC